MTLKLHRDIIPLKEVTMSFKSETNPKAKLTLSQVQIIKQALYKGVSVKDLAQEYGVSPSAISRIKRNRTWRNNQ